MKMIYCFFDSKRVSNIAVLVVLILSMLSSCDSRKSVVNTSDIDTLVQNADSILPENVEDRLTRVVSHLDLKQDLSVYVINPKRIWAEEMRKEDWTPRPEPLGFRGADFDRFYIHYNSVSRIDDKRYHVVGKTRCMGKICDIKGDIVIDSVVAYAPDVYYIKEVEETGVICASYHFDEYEGQNINGYYIGNASFEYLILGGKAYYDAALLIADGFYNNQYKGVWVDVQKNDTLKCNWGDFRIPESEELDEGCGEFIPSDDAQKNHGWDHFFDAEHENQTWWK